MTTNLYKHIPPNLRLAVTLIFIAAPAILAAYIVETQFLPKAGWALVIVFLAIFGFVYARIAAARFSRTEALADILQQIVEDKYVSSESDTAAGKLKDRAPHQATEKLINNIRDLQLDKHRAEMVLANMADGVIAVDCEGKITLFNSAAGQIFSVKSSNIVGQSLIDADLHPEVARLALECISDRKVSESEIKLPGVPQHVIQMHAAPFRATDTGTDCAMIILHDLSEVRRHEQNQKEFVSNVSHELKTPITAIRTTAEVLLAGAKNDEEVVDRFLNTIVSETDRLSALIDDLMEIARRDSGINKVEKSEVNIAEIINRAVTAVLPQATQKEISVEINVPKTLVCYCDDIQIMQLVRNLVENAVKYTPSGGTVEVAAQESGSGHMIWVKDTGIGIPQGEVSRIFERFYRVDKARSRRMGGTGLGLSIVKDIVESHGGEIAVETQLGRGSKFIVTLPSEG